jgi:hypothetical protein
MKFAKVYVVDTNVPKVANLATKPEEDSDVPDTCIFDCVKAIEYVTQNKALVIDNGDEIFNEYHNNLSLKGQPGIGDHFMKWVNDYRWSLPEVNQVQLTKENDSYMQFPHDVRLADFDLSDHKFVAVANGHPGSPPILEATDSKWWGYKDVLSELGIKICFLCPEYVETKYMQKMGVDTGTEKAGVS